MPNPARETRRASRERIETVLALAQDLKTHQLRIAEQSRALSLAELEAADLSPVPLALLSRRGVILSAGKPLFDLLEVPAEAVLFQALTNFLCPEDVPLLFKFLGSARNTRKVRRAEFFLAAPDRAPKHVLLVISPAEGLEPSHGVFRAAFVETDTGQPEWGPRTAREDTRLMQLIDGIVWEAESPMRFTFVSQQAERILGFSPQNWLRDPDFWEKHIYRDDRERVVQARAAAASAPASHVLEYRMVTADRRMIWVKDSAVIIAGTAGWTKMCGIITDITDLERTQAQLRHANEHLEFAVLERTAKMEQSLDAMETLCYGIAHDLKAPLRGLQGFITLLASEYESVFKDDAKTYVTRCQAALRRMGQLIDSILLYGRLNHTLPELMPIHLRPLIDRVLNSLEPDITARKAAIKVQMTFPPAVGNPYLLEQVFTNLISNALKFTLPGVRPEISISATQLEGPINPSTNPPIHQSINPSAHPSAAPVVRVTVTDNGIGIPLASTTRMFGMFQKLHRPEEYPGTGIGLAMVKRAAELMNGRVGVFSEPGQGSSFWIELPSASDQ